MQVFFLIDRLVLQLFWTNIKMTAFNNVLIWFWFIVVNVLFIASTIKCNDLLRAVLHGGTDDELVCAQIVYRHGNRSIIATYPNDPYKDEKWWPGYGELTNVSAQHPYIASPTLTSFYEYPNFIT